MNDKNLIALGGPESSPERDARIRKMGGAARAEKCRRNKLLREKVLDILGQKPKLSKKQLKTMTKQGFDAENIDVLAYVIAGLIASAAAGNALAAGTLFDTAGINTATINAQERLDLDRDRLRLAKQQAEEERKRRETAQQSTGQLDKLIAGLNELKNDDLHT